MSNKKSVPNFFLGVSLISGNWIIQQGEAYTYKH